MRASKILACCLGVTAVAAATSVAPRAFATFGTWETSSPVMYINPQNADVSDSAAEAAVLSAMEVWNTEGGSPFRFVYGGRTNETSFGQDGRSVVIFRNESNGSTLGSTYAWSWNGVLIETDVVFWDGGFQFYTGTSGCSGGMYIEDVATHELGHSAGLSHSEYPDATMYPSASAYCSQDWRSLSSDDIAALQSIYGSATRPSPPPANTAPTVYVSSPTNGATYASGDSVAFAGSGSDAEDGDLTSVLSWRSNIDGTLGTGSGFWRVLSDGTHSITATVTDSAGSSTSTNVSITVGITVAPISSPKVKPARGGRRK